MLPASGPPATTPVAARSTRPQPVSLYCGAVTRVLILLTNVFPHARGEEFIETELPHLAAGFDRVVVASTKTREGDEITRAVPPNVEVVATGRDLPADRRGRLLEAARGVPTLRPANLRESGTEPRRILLDASYGSLTQRSTRALRTELLDHWDDWQLGEATITLYSFWLHTPARTAGLIADWLRARGATVAGVVSRAHGYDVYPDVHRARYLPQRRATLAGVDRVFVVSRAGRESIVRTVPEAADKVEVRHLGTHDPGPVIEPSRSPFHLVSCAFLSPVKRLDRVPAIVALLRSRGVDARWTHIGSAADLNSFAAQTKAVLGLAEDGSDVARFEGYVPHSELVATYRRLRPSVLVSLSRSEGMPVNLMEGASLGLPMVATEVGGVPELVPSRFVDGGDPDNGWLLPVDFTDEQAADALHDLATRSDAEFARLGQRSREIWAAGFDEAVVYPAFVRELHDLERTPR